MPTPRRPRRLAALLLTLALAVALVATHPLALVRALIALGFSDVPRVAPHALERAMRRPHPPLILDARTPDEFAVSHLRGALRIDPDRPDFSLAGSDRARPIVVYCAVGYRSALVARALRRAGFRDARNLDGGVFAWANAALPLWRGDAGVCDVHPYSARWAPMLDRARRCALDGGVLLPVNSRP